MSGPKQREETMTGEQKLPAVAGPLDGPVGRLKPERCHAGKDGDCMHQSCPQLRDSEPHKTGRHCPLGIDDSDDSWLDDDDNWCDRCDGDGMDPMTDYLLPCPACQGEQR
jgi:hypothetical protein